MSAKIREPLLRITCSTISSVTRRLRAESNFNNQDIRLGTLNPFKSMAANTDLRQILQIWLIQVQITILSNLISNKREEDLNLVTITDQTHR
jgi:hypothetical protein